MLQVNWMCLNSCEPNVPETKIKSKIEYWQNKHELLTMLFIVVRYFEYAFTHQDPVHNYPFFRSGKTIEIMTQPKFRVLLRMSTNQEDHNVLIRNQNHQNHSLNTPRKMQVEILFADILFLIDKLRHVVVFDVRLMEQQHCPQTNRHPVYFHDWCMMYVYCIPHMHVHQPVYIAYAQFIITRKNRFVWWTIEMEVHWAIGISINTHSFITVSVNVSFLFLTSVTFNQTIYPQNVWSII